MNRALLFANGVVSERMINLVKNKRFDWVIAADGGARHALHWGYHPNFVVGDFDSLTPEVRRKLTQSKFIHLPSQHLNDLEKALIQCQELNVSHMTLLGVTGNRLDHTLSNLSVLSRYEGKFKLTIYDADGELHYVRDSFRFEGQLGQTLSLIPVGEVSGVVTVGLRFPLKSENLVFGAREGLSNRVISNPVEIRVGKGLLIVFILYPDDKP
ncbi:MAG: thiamine diphosphokinase [Calditrichia bacterium]